jgi:hypothetical protein
MLLHFVAARQFTLAKLKLKVPRLGRLSPLRRVSDKASTTKRQNESTTIRRRQHHVGGVVVAERRQVQQSRDH